MIDLESSEDESASENVDHAALQPASNAGFAFSFGTTDVGTAPQENDMTGQLCQQSWFHSS